MTLNDFRTQEIKWDKANRQMFTVFQVSSGDSNGRKLSVQVLDEGKIVDLTGIVLSLAWQTKNKKNYGLDAFRPVDATKGIFDIFYTTEMLSNTGTLRASLVLVDGTGRVESDSFSIMVKDSVVNDSSVQSENSFTALTEALIQINKYQSDIDGIKQDLVDESNQLITTEKAELDALQLDYSERAGTLEETYAPRLTEVTAQLAQTMSQKEFDSWVATLLDGGPSIYMETLAALKAAYPSGSAGIALVRETNPAKIYVWKNESWTFFGDYQGMELKDDSLSTSKYKNDSITSSKVDFFSPQGKNLYNPENPSFLKNKKFVVFTNEIIDSTNSHITNSMEIKPTQKVFISTDGVEVTSYASYVIAFYNAVGTFLSSTYYVVRGVSAPINAASFKVQTWGAHKKIQIEVGTEVTSWTAYEEPTIKKEALKKINSNDVEDGSLSLKKTNWAEEIILNIHNPSTDTLNAYVTQSGQIVTGSLEWKVSDFIEVKPGQVLTNDSGLYGSFYDTLKVPFGEIPLAINKTYTVPKGVRFVRHTYPISSVGVLCEGSKVEKPNASFKEEKVKITEQNLIDDIKLIVSSSIPVKTEGKKVVVFADSIGETHKVSDDGLTHTFQTYNFPYYMSEILKTNYKNYAQWGASYRTRDGLEFRQSLKNQIQAASTGSPTADIVIVALGTNDGISLLGNYETAMSKTSLEDLDTYNLYEAIRYGFWRLRLLYPNAIFYVGLPIQRASATPTYLAPMLEAIERMANYYNFIIIDAQNRSGVVREFEVNNGAGKDLIDGLHPNGATKIKLGKFYANEVLKSYFV